MIGRMLDVSAQVLAGPGEDAAISCFAAEVYYADARQKSPVLSMRSASTTQGTVLRVQLDEPVNETFVTVILNASCGSNTSRRYVLLADVPLALATKISTEPTLVVLPSQTTSVAAQAVTPNSENKSPETAKKPKSGKKSAQITGAPKSKQNKSVNEASATTGKARLKLDAMTFLSDRMDSLDMPMLFAPTEDVLLHAKQISSLETDLKTLRKQAAGQDLKLLDLQTQLHDAQSQQIPLWMIYGAALALLVCLLALAWLWQRQRQLSATGHAWWQDPDKNDAPSTVLVSRMPETQPSDFSHTVQTPPVKSSPTVTPVSEKKAPEVDLDITTGSFMLSNAKRSPAETGKAVKGHHLMAEDILDVRQQADFFVSLGQTERALDILCKQISQASEPNPLLHLDLITLYHALGMKSDFSVQRDNFSHYFNCIIPEFAHFTQEDKSLDGYPEVQEDLTRLWPNVQALAYLDACIYRDAQEHEETFDLAAFRDLLTLHALAEVVATETKAPPPKPLHKVKPKKVTAVQEVSTAKPVATPLATPSPKSLPSLPSFPAPAAAPSQKMVTAPSVPEITAPLLSDAELLASLPSIFMDFEVKSASVAPAKKEPLPSLPEAGKIEEPIDTLASGLIPPRVQNSMAEPVRPLALATPAAAPSVGKFEPIAALEAEPEAPTRMLDLDFSNLESSAKETSTETPASPSAAARYATRSRWPVSKKPGKTDLP